MYSLLLRAMVDLPCNRYHKISTTKSRQGIKALAPISATWCTLAYCNIANAYYNGVGVERNEKKSKHYFD